MDDFLLERHYPENTDSSKDHRHATERDRDRILHSAAFRRLQGKTQVFSIGQADFYRTRLTHSIETAQIAKAIAHNLCVENPELCRCLTPELAETVALAHDLGHPPFGHTGERILDACMKEISQQKKSDQRAGLRFEGNAQTFHILVAAEPKSPDYPGLNLTRATLTGVIKYPFVQSASADKFIFASDVPIANWALTHSGGLTKTPGSAGAKKKAGNTSRPRTSFVCQIMNWADDCAYSVHDVEDALQAQFLHPGDLEQTRFVHQVADRYEETHVEESVPRLGFSEVRERLLDLKRRIAPPDSGGDERARRKAALRDISNELITTVSLRSLAGSHRTDFAWQLEVAPESRILAVLCKTVIWEAVITDPRVVMVNTRGREVLRDLFYLLAEDVLENGQVDIFPRYYRPIVEDAIRAGEAEAARAVCNYLALMTDMDALRLHAILRGYKASSVLDFI